MAEHCFPKAMAYLENHWQGKKTTNLYQNTALSVQLASSFENSNEEEFAELYQKGEKLFRKNGIFLGKKLFLEGKYADAVELLQNIQKKTNYQEVQRQYMLAMCYEALKETNRRLSVWNMSQNTEIPRHADMRQNSGRKKMLL